MKIFLAITAVLAWTFGLALLFVPSKFYLPVGMALTPMLSTVAQAHGATLVGLGVINWLTRAANKRGLVAVLTGSLLLQSLSLVLSFERRRSEQEPRMLLEWSFTWCLGDCFCSFY